MAEELEAVRLQIAAAGGVAEDAAAWLAVDCGPAQPDAGIDGFGIEQRHGIPQNPGWALLGNRIIFLINVAGQWRHG
jgi:hypothetical protein